MKIKELKYERKFFLGEFQTEGLGVMAEVTEGEDPIAVMTKLREFVESQGVFGREKFKSLRKRNDSIAEAQALTEKLKDATSHANAKKRKAD